MWCSKVIPKGKGSSREALAWSPCDPAMLSEPALSAFMVHVALVPFNSSQGLAGAGEDALLTCGCPGVFMHSLVC